MKAPQLAAGLFHIFKSMKKSIFNWSGGKDSAYALWKVLQEKEYDIYTLMTSCNAKEQRISMHGVRVPLLEEQAKSIGLPLDKLELPENLDMASYDQYLHERLGKIKEQGVEYSIFGDIFLEDLKEYREKQLAKVGLKGAFPIWKHDTKQQIQDFLELGFKTIVVAVNERQLGEEFVGRVIDEQFIKDLPEGVDPCGENGEFHTFVFDGPIFDFPIQFEVGEKVRKVYKVNHDLDDDDDTFKHPKGEAAIWFCDLVPK